MSQRDMILVERVTDGEKIIDRVKEYMRYDDDLGCLIRTKKSGNTRPGDRAGHKGPKGYTMVRLFNFVYFEHRIIWLLFSGKWPQKHIDHINGVRSDNRIGNLREANNSQNMQNLQGPLPRNKCGYLGVVKRRRKYAALICVGGVRRHIGLYPTPQEAHEEYMRVKKELHPFGSIAQDNAAFPQIGGGVR